jgi:hypothetical protein
VNKETKRVKTLLDLIGLNYDEHSIVVNDNIVDIRINPRIPIEHIKIDIKVNKS